MSERPASPTQIAKELGIPRPKIAYHVRALAAKGRDRDAVPLIELVDISKRKGGREHFYRAIVQPIVGVSAAEKMSPIMRVLLSKAGVDLIIGDLTPAIRDGTFDQHPQRSMLRKHIQLDDEGMEKSAEIMLQTLEELTELEAESVGRIAQSGAESIPVAIALLLYPKAELQPR